LELSANRSQKTFGYRGRTKSDDLVGSSTYRRDGDEAAERRAGRRRGGTATRRPAIRRNGDEAAERPASV
jgi:hypothetical protein